MYYSNQAIQTLSIKYPSDHFAFASLYLNRSKILFKRGAYKEAVYFSDLDLSIRCRDNSSSNYAYSLFHKSKRLYQPNLYNESKEYAKQAKNTYYDRQLKKINCLLDKLSN